MLSLASFSIPGRLAAFLTCLLVAAGTAWLVPASPELSEAARAALFILVFAAGLWISDAIPAFAVGILIIGLQIAILGRPGGVFASTETDWEQFGYVIGNPLVWLFFGGFVLAAGMSRAGLDVVIAQAILGKLGSSPGRLLLGVMLVAFGLSMFMSNTATTAMLVAMLAPIVATRGEGDRLATGLLLAVAVAANVGGMASLIGTPPNAIAVGALRAMPDGLQLSFFDWLWIGLPPAALLLAVSYAIVRWKYFGKDVAFLELRLTQDSEAKPSPGAYWQSIVVAVCALATVGLWFTGQWHGIPTAVVSFLPIVVFTSVGILRENEIRGLPYDVLFLLAGGLALGQTVTMTGLSNWLVGLVPIEGLPPVLLVLLMGIVTVLLSNFMSNTAAANVLIPLSISLATGFESKAAITIALCASTAMCLPVATPPNAMVFATERVSTKDFMVMGAIFGVLGPPLATAWTFWVMGG